jgi:anti-sigma factor (TIGR02949 family)
MMVCAEWHDQIAAYVDGELPSSEMAALRAHAEACPACASQALALMQGKLAVRSAANRYTAPPSLRARIVQLTKEAAEERRNVEVTYRLPWHRLVGMWWPQSLAAAAALLLLVGFLIAYGQRKQGQAVAELSDLHVTALASANPVEVISTDRHTVKPWFQGRIPFSFNLPELQGSPFTLVGGRVAYFHQEPGAHLIFTYQRHMISTFIFRNTPQLGFTAAPFAGHPSSFNLQTWTQGDLRYVVLGDVNANTIGELAKLLQQAR